VPANGSYAEPTGQVPVITGGNPDLKPETSRTWVFGGVYSPTWARDNGLSALSLEVNYYDIKLDNAIASVGADVTLNRCALTGDAASCALVSRSGNGFLSQINGLLQNIGGIRTKGIDVTFNIRTSETSIGAFGLFWDMNFLLKYDEIIPATNGFETIDRKGSERGSPDQAFPKYKATATIDWSLGGFGASFTGRYISSVNDTQLAETNKYYKLDSRFYGDVQLTYQPDFMDRRFQLAVGVNNVFNQDPPSCVSCSLNNFDPTTYDVPGQFGYIRLTYKM
jgi:iron complex outermembrane receptor protein